MTERYFTALDAEKELGIPAGTVRSWYARQERTGLYPVGLDERWNRPLFAERDLIALRDGQQVRDGDGRRL